jgi:hypothetical protein
MSALHAIHAYRSPRINHTVEGTANSVESRARIILASQLKNVGLRIRFGAHTTAIGPRRQAACAVVQHRLRSARKSLGA